VSRSLRHALLRFGCGDLPQPLALGIGTRLKLACGFLEFIELGFVVRAFCHGGATFIEYVSMTPSAGTGNDLTTNTVVGESTVCRRTYMRRSLSVSPQTVIVAPGYAVPPSEVEDLIAGRKSERGNFMYQAVFKRLLRGEKDIDAAPVGQNLFGNGGALL